MGWFYPPPPPFIGGQQPYDPGRRRLQSVDPSPIVHPARRPAFNAIVSQWQPPFPGTWAGPASGQQPYVQRQLYPGLLNNPPPGWISSRRNRALEALVRSTWPEPNWPAQRAPNTQLVSVDRPAPRGPRMDSISIWQPPIWPAQAPPNTQISSVDRPPRQTRLSFSIPDSPATRQSYAQIAPLIPAAVTTSTLPYVSVAAQSAVLQSWQAPSWNAQSAPDTQISSVDQPPPYSIAAQSSITEAWDRSFMLAVEPSSFQPPEIDNPPPYSVAPIATIMLQWPPVTWSAQSAPPKTETGFDQPPPFDYPLISVTTPGIWWALNYTIQGPRTLGISGPTPPPAIVNPPPYSIAVLMGIVQQWVLPTQYIFPPVVTPPAPPPLPPVGPPPPLPYGPALWWRDRESRLLIREEAERAKRIRLGILSKPEEKQVEKALQQAVEAIRQLPTTESFKPDQKLELSERTYISIIERELSDDLREGFAAVELWRAEVRNRVMQEEDDDMMLIIMSIYMG